MLLDLRLEAFIGCDVIASFERKGGDSCQNLLSEERVKSGRLHPAHDSRVFAVRQLCAKNSVSSFSCYDSNFQLELIGESGLLLLKRFACSNRARR